MVLFPKLAKTLPDPGAFKRGVWIGIFAPVDEQADLVFSRIVDPAHQRARRGRSCSTPRSMTRSTASPRSALSNGSFCRRQTANPRAKIEGSSYHIIVIDECQDADEQVIRKSIHPMLAFYAGTIVKIGTPGYHKGDFYKAINLNKRRQTSKRARQNHFEYDYRVVCKYNPNYKKFIEQGEAPPR